MKMIELVQNLERTDTYPCNIKGQRYKHKDKDTAGCSAHLYPYYKVGTGCKGCANSNTRDWVRIK